jgi:hypothetical protein
MDRWSVHHDDIIHIFMTRLHMQCLCQYDVSCRCFMVGNAVVPGFAIHILGWCRAPVVVLRLVAGSAGGLGVVDVIHHHLPIYSALPISTRHHVSSLMALDHSVDNGDTH